MVTLGIIGVVAAMTMPSLIANYQKKALLEQFKVAHSLIQQAWKKAESSLGYTPECYYWLNGTKYSSVCQEYDEYGSCLKRTLPDGSPLPADYMGSFSECSVFMGQIVKELNIIRVCNGNGFKSGCIPDYKGYDTVQASLDDSLSDEAIASKSKGCANFRENEIKNNRTIYIMSNGMIMFPFSGPQLFAVDINGKKGPNKWGYDLFTFSFKGNVTSTPRIVNGGCMQVEKGGNSTKQMIINSYK